MRAHLALAFIVLSGCKTSDPLYCDEDTPCSDPDRPYCDLSGEYAASDGHGRTCIASPFDAGVKSDGGNGTPGDLDAAGPRRIVQLATGSFTSCAVFNDGGMRCWGTGELGYGQDETVGDDEAPYMKGDVPVGGRVIQVGLGTAFMCVLYDDGNVRCWGSGSNGRLGYGNTDSLGDSGDTPAMLDNVPLGAKATQIAVGHSHACALLEGGLIRCWGGNGAGELGYGHQEDVGDNETPDSEDPVDVGGVAIQVAAGQSHSCAVLEGGRLQCWGSSLYGSLGYGNSDNIGASNSPVDAGDVVVGGSVEAVVTGVYRTCVLLDDKDVRCWGQLNGIGRPDIEEDYGDSDGETPAAAGDLEIGADVAELTTGTINCARVESGSVRCWGTGDALGYGDSEPVGDDETPAAAGNVALGDDAVLISDGSKTAHVCALLEDGDVRCWGGNAYYQLGLGHMDDVGDGETPNSQDPVQVLDPEE